MKALKITILALLASTSTAFGQNENKVIKTDLRKKLIVSEKGSYYIKQHETTEEYSPVVLDPEDKNKINQSVVRLPTQIKKIIKLDFDRDVGYDKEVEINYLRYKEITLNFVFDETGILTTTNNFFINVLKIKDKVSGAPVVQIGASELLGPKSEGLNGWSKSQEMAALAKAQCSKIRGVSHFGYKKTGCSVVTYSNTPNNSLPLIHYISKAGEWSPLFPRSSRV